MTRLKRWLIDRILSVWAREELRKEIDKLRAENQEQMAHIRELNACIDGMQYCVRHQQRIAICMTEPKTANEMNKEEVRE